MMKHSDWQKELMAKLNEAAEIKFAWKKLPARSKEEELRIFVREIKEILKEVRND